MIVDTIFTDRLVLNKLTVQEAGFIYHLLNTAEWIRFIGDRKIATTADALAYIEKILANPNINYWVVTVKESSIAIGVITLIKRDYLAFHDIGFAFFVAHSKHGYAYEASKAVLERVSVLPQYPVVLAITSPDNINSIRLLEKLGLHFMKNIAVEKENLLMYST